jgi:hypothetical protein
VGSLEELPEDGDGEYRVDFRERPGYYRVERGEQGVFKVQPYKSELLPFWEYADRAAADRAGEAVYRCFEAYRRLGEFPGMDMARKYLQMGYTRSMRYARYPGGKKYVEGEKREPVRWADRAKLESALVFSVWRERVADDPAYRAAKERHRERWG